MEGHSWRGRHSYKDRMACLDFVGGSPGPMASALCQRRIEAAQQGPQQIHHQRALAGFHHHRGLHAGLQLQALTMLASDPSHSSKAVAEKLFISENTLRKHVTSIYSKLGLANRVDLYAFAQRNGLT